MEPRNSYLRRSSRRANCGRHETFRFTTAYKNDLKRINRRSYDLLLLASVVNEPSTFFPKGRSFFRNVSCHHLPIAYFCNGWLRRKFHAQFMASTPCHFARRCQPSGCYGEPKLVGDYSWIGHAKACANGTQIQNGAPTGDEAVVDAYDAGF